ncbi:MAG: hypothetical protein IKG44_00255 [Mogibacterium sp.]|nr:hypothetical protein [Mogibacterium sp.]
MTDLIPIQQALENTGIYTAYFEIESERQAPYIIWRGNGQNNFIADDTFYFKMGNTYEVDFYFLVKSEEVEEVIEQALLDAGFLYSKGEDLRDENTKEFLIIYSVWPGIDRYDNDDEEE